MNKTLSIVVLLALACAPATNVDLDDIELLVVAGNTQTGPAFEELPDPLVVNVLKPNGKPLKDQIVNFVVVEGGGSVFAGVARSNKQGLAQERWTLGEAGPQQVEVRAVHPATGEKLVFGTFTATAVALEPRFMQCQDVDDGSWKSSGCFRPVLVNSTFAARFRIVAPDNVTVVPGQDVTFTVDPFCMSGGTATCDNPGSVTPASSTTDVNGEVVANWTVGPNEGPNKLVVGWIRGENGFWVTSVDPPPLVPTAIQCFDIDTGT